MVERVYRPQPGDDPSAPFALMREGFKPEYAMGQAIKTGGGGLTDPLNIGDLLTEGGEYGITAWDDMFDEQGNLINEQAFRRSMNVGSVMAQDPSTGMDAGTAGRSGLLSYGWGNESPTSPYGPGGGELEQWLHSIGYGGQEAGSTWYGRNKKDTPGQWYNPESLGFTGEGMDLGSATQESLNQWAMDTYGVPLQYLAAWNPEVHETMKSWGEDESQWWNPELGGLDVTTIPGMGGLSSGNYMTAFGDSYDANIGRMGGRATTALGELQQRAMLGDPQGYGRSAMGHGRGTQLALGGPYQQGMTRMAPKPMDYSGYMAMEMAPFQQMQAMNQYWNQYAQ